MTNPFTCGIVGMLSCDNFSIERTQNIWRHGLIILVHGVLAWF